MDFIEKSLKYKQVTLTVLFIVFCVGVYSLLNMSRREDPKLTNPQGLVVAFYPGASSTQVEEQVTKKIEECLFKFEEVKKNETVSSSEEGKVIITVILKEDVKALDVFWNKLSQQLMLLRQTELPDGVIGPIVNSDFGDTEAMIVGISGEGVPYNQLKHYSRQLEEQLRTLPEVSKVKRAGDLAEQIQVFTNSAKMAQYGVNQQDIIRILKSQNDVYPTGDLDISSFKVPLYTKGYYNTQEELENQIVGASQSGSVVRLKDIATFSRAYADPANKIKVNEEEAVIVSIQMHSGNNIVKFGKDVNAKLEHFRKTIPSNVKVTTIADQPYIVDKSISGFLKEFMLAIIAVIIVIVLMLPFRISVVASLAIPMTIAFTLAIMNVFGLELHQVSLSTLIVVLGLVVDNAIVVVDNYVELLDKGVNRWDAARRSAKELVIPILTATLTIVLAFAPMLMLTGVIGEFIQALPLTIAISLSASFIVSMVFTPLLCYAFIKKGLHSPGVEQKKKGSLLDKMQSGYNRALDWTVVNPKKTISLGLLSLALALVIFKFGIKQKFFPEAERNQFVMELRMPTGTNLNTTEKATAKLENLIKNDERVIGYNSFIGTSAPRFFYNFSPEFPVSSYAQIIVNTIDVKSTYELFAELSHKVEDVVPEGSPQVRLMQQGQPMKAPVEVRIQGDDLYMLKVIGQQVDSIIKSKKSSFQVKNDYMEDYFGVDIRLMPEAQRLGFTSEVIAKSVYAGFSGAPVTTIREGENNIDVVLRLDENKRQTTTDLNRIYLTSPVTGASVPLGQIAELAPTWKTGKVIHRNGIRVLTVQSETTGGILPSQLLSEIRPEIARLSLPLGYEITYGGEYNNQQKTFPNMIKCLLIGVLLIFLVLLFQFQSLKEAAIIMLTVPLSLFGAIAGLLITGNNFGFMAFVGLISLSGLVVRNAIILIDHIHELEKHHGMNLREATIESGKRRLRPIFLTAMAAAIGVVPMILSGSPLWSSLASVMAFGVIWGMVIGLLFVPACYLIWLTPKSKMKNEK